MTQINPSLDAVSKALELLGSPQNCYQSIIVAGTNGKGSTCTFLELLYLNSGLNYKIGKYSSPHLIKLNERFAINGQDISDEELIKLSQELSQNPALQALSLTEFELQTIIAFEYFKRHKIDIAILEVGMGGRWDATNTIASRNRLATVITNIGLDHMQYLGNTIELIRKEKEAIKREGVVHFEGKPNNNNPNSSSGENFLLATDIFTKLSGIEVGKELSSRALEQFPDRYKGRYVYHSNILIDGAHNEPGMFKLNQYLQSLNKQSRKIFVLAFLDKDYKRCLAALFHNLIKKDRDIVICTELNSNRSTKAKDLISELQIQGLVNIHATKNSSSAFELAERLRIADDLVIITGSLMLVADYYTVYSKAETN